MTNPDFHRAIRRIQRQHWLQYPVQGLLMGGAMLGASGQTAVGTTLEPALTTWPVLLGLFALLLVVSGLLWLISRYLRPNLRRPAEENLRIYQGRVLLRNSLLGLLALPLLASYAVNHKPLDLVLCGAVLLTMGWYTQPSAVRYQRWLVA